MVSQIQPKFDSALDARCEFISLVLYSALRGLSLRFPVSPSHQKPAFHFLMISEDFRGFVASLISKTPMLGFY